MNVRSAIAPLALTIALSLSFNARAAGAFAFDGIPGIAENQQLEAAFFVEDLRALRAMMQIQRAYIERAAFGRDYFSPEHQKALLGIDVYGELERLLAIAAPKGSAVPAVIAIVSSGDQIRGQLAIKVEEGVVERLVKASAAKPSFAVTGDANHLVFKAKEIELPAKVDGSWLRIGIKDEDLALTGKAPLTALPDGIARWTQDAHMVFAIFGGGTFAKALAGGMDDNPFMQNVVQTSRALAFAFRFDADMSQIVRVVLDSEAIGSIGPMVRRSDMMPTATNWDAQAMTVASLSVPPMALTTVLTLAQMQIGEQQDPAVAELVGAAQSINGQLSIADFGSPGDWAVSAEFADDAAAQRFVATTHKAIQGLANRYGVEPGLVKLDGQALKLRPDTKLSDTTVTTFGKSVVVARQRTRAERLATMHTKKGKTFLDGPLTPAVRDLLARPAIFQGYTIAAYDGTLIDWFYWPAKLVEIGVKHMHAMPADAFDASAFGSPFALGVTGMSGLTRLPLTLAVASYSLATVYDYAVALDVDGTDIVLQIATSPL